MYTIRRTFQRCSLMWRPLRRQLPEAGDEVAPVRLSAVRSWVGLAMPRAAANASAISSGVNRRSARS